MQWLSPCSLLQTIFWYCCPQVLLSIESLGEIHDEFIAGRVLEESRMIWSFLILSHGETFSVSKRHMVG